LLPLFAVVAGMISFTSPCALPLIPSYLCFISGLPLSEIGTRAARPLVLRSSLSFVAGFTVVFSALGATSSVVGSILVRHLPLILQISGGFIIVLGLAMVGLMRLPLLSQERRFDLSRLPAGPRGAFPLGMAFAFGWTPCVGPVLAAILAIASATRTVEWGVTLLVLYSLGLGIPFLLLAMGFTRARRSLSWFRKHAKAVETLGGLLLVGVGVLFVTGAWRALLLPVRANFAHFGWPPL
jgi:cytochrome c-type biogenesis protein